MVTNFLGPLTGHYFQTAMMRTMTNIIKHGQIHVHLFRIKPNVLLALLIGHFTENMQEAM